MKSDNDSVIEFEWIEVNIDDDCKAVQPDADAQPEVVEDSVKGVKSINKKIKVLCGAGISTGDDMKAAMDLGADGVLLASGIVKAENPKEALLDLVSKL